VSFNAWHQPWLPVARGTTHTRISLREFYTDSSTYSGLGSGLSPLDHDALHRLLAAVGAVIVRELSRRDLARHAEAGTFPVEGIATFEVAYAARFALAGHNPFLQRWDKTALDIEAAAAAKKKPTEAVLFPVAQWAVRRSTLDAADPAVLTLLLVTSFFHVRDGNGRDLWGGKAAKGSIATWTTNPMAVFLLHKDNLGCTVYANTPPRVDRGRLTWCCANVSGPHRRSGRLHHAATRALSLHLLAHASSRLLARGQAGGFHARPDAIPRSNPRSQQER